MAQLLRVSPTADTPVQVNWVWAAIAVMSLVLVGLLAPMGLALLGLLGVIITMHEAGHFVAAKRAGMQPVEFFWGFGPEIVAFERNGTRFGLKALFIGGYVKLHGMSPTSHVPEDFAEAGTYRAASNGGRLLTILAGPAVNLVAALVAFSVANWITGMALTTGVTEAFALMWFILSSTGAALFTFVVELPGYLGALMNPDLEPPVRFLSPVAQAQVTESALTSGWATSIRWFAILSCAIGAVNLIPLPPLDGSHALVVAIDAIRARLGGHHTVRFDVRRLEPVAYVTLAALMLLTVTALIMDIRDVLA